MDVVSKILGDDETLQSFNVDILRTRNVLFSKALAMIGDEMTTYGGGGKER